MPEKSSHDRGGDANARPRAAQQDAAERALAMKNAAPKAERDSMPKPEGASNEGMRPIPNEDLPPSGALDAEGGKPALERSHKNR
jgi:hypothetical protein